MGTCLAREIRRSRFEVQRSASSPVFLTVEHVPETNCALYRQAPAAFYPCRLRDGNGIPADARHSGDPALLIFAGVSGDGTFTQEDLQHLRHELGTDCPIHIQYANWMWGLLQGDLGTSLYYRTPIVRELGPRIPPTLELAFLAVFGSLVLAVPLGVLSAVKQDTLLDYVARLFTFAGISIPIFVIGLTVDLRAHPCVWLVSAVGIYLLMGGSLDELPTDDLSHPGAGLLRDQLHRPGHPLGDAGSKEMDYVQAARAAGAGPWRMIFRHMVPNCAAPPISSLPLPIWGTR